MTEEADYNFFFEFIKNYSGNGFKGINNQDHFMVRLNRMLDKGRQFFYIADIPRFQLLYTSPQILDIYGIEPEKFDLSYNFINTHPFEIQRRSKARVNTIEVGQELFMKKSGTVLISSNFTMKAPMGEYIPVGSNLSDRELEVLTYIHKGMGSKEISRKLSLSLYTINTHRRNILKKAGKSSIGEVIFELEGIGMI